MASGGLEGKRTFEQIMATIFRPTIDSVETADPEVFKLFQQTAKPVTKKGPATAPDLGDDSSSLAAAAKKDSRDDSSSPAAAAAKRDPQDDSSTAVPAAANSNGCTTGQASMTMPSSHGGMTGRATVTTSSSHSGTTGQATATASSNSPAPCKNDDTTEPVTVKSEPRAMPRSRQ